MIRFKHIGRWEEMLVEREQRDQLTISLIDPNTKQTIITYLDAEQAHFLADQIKQKLPSRLGTPFKIEGVL